MNRIEVINGKLELLLSFDDGPAPLSALDGILSTLDEQNIKAEFYVCGQSVCDYPEGARKIVEAGHKIQNHSWSHINLETATEEAVRSELENTQNVIFSTTGITATKLRPPYGAGGWPGNYSSVLVANCHKLGLEIQNWDFDTEDWKMPGGIDAEKFQQLLAESENRESTKPIYVLMHVREQTALDLPNFINQLREAGFSFAEPL